MALRDITNCKQHRNPLSRRHSGQIKWTHKTRRNLKGTVLSISLSLWTYKTRRNSSGTPISFETLLFFIPNSTVYLQCQRTLDGICYFHNDQIGVGDFDMVRKSWESWTWCTTQQQLLVNWRDESMVGIKSSFLKGQHVTGWRLWFWGKCLTSYRWSDSENSNKRMLNLILTFIVQSAIPYDRASLGTVA